ncbi:MAG: GGDEF domain-containing protein [Acidimicrobiales bacterium]|nr:GGDEF domain-containing protein [Acidimicrobiales bacterium]
MKTILAGPTAGRTPRWLDRQLSPAIAIGISAVVLLGVAAGDFLTGPYLVFATFYLAPVAFTAWFAGRVPGLVMAIVASCSGVIVTAVDPREVTPPIYVLNGVFRFITYSVVVLLVTAEKSAMDTIRSLASTDQLTGFLNRPRFYELAGRELARATRSRQPLALVYIDVDELKQRNDTYGHEAGDAMLAAFAAAVRGTLRATDLVARVGGDEFILLLPEADADSAVAIVERLRERLEIAEPLPIRFSAGVVAGVVGDDDVESLVRRADLLMLEAKRAGRGRTVAAGCVVTQGSATVSSE